MQKFLPFFEDLRHRLYRSAVLFAVSFAVGLFSVMAVMKRVLAYVQIDQVVIATSSPFQFANVAMNFGFFIALMVTIPYVVYSFYAFISPALTKRERRTLLKSVPLCIFLFVLGFSYGFFVLYFALELLAAINTQLGIANFWNVGQFLSEMVVTSALLGLVFEFPLLLTLLVKMGVLTTQHLKDKRRIAYFSTLLLTAMLPPTDGLSLVVMSLPLVLLYEATIVLTSNDSTVWLRARKVVPPAP